MNISSTLSVSKRLIGNEQFKFSAFSTYEQEITKIFNEKVQPLYGDQTFNLERFTSGTSRRCEAMRKDKKIFGIIAYMNKLQKRGGDQSIFEIRNMLLVKEKYYDKNYQIDLLMRIVKLATDRKAEKVDFLVGSGDVRLVDFLKTKQFVQTGTETLSKDRKQAVILSCLTEQLRSQFKADDVIDTKNEKKRKRDSEGEYNSQNNPPKKKTCLESDNIQESKDLFQRPSQGSFHRPTNFQPTSPNFESGLVSKQPMRSTTNRPILSKSISEPYLNNNNSPRNQELTLRKIYIHQIRNKLKTVEGRIQSTVRNYRAGDTIRFFYKANERDDVKCRIVKIDYYGSFAVMLEACGFEKCLAEVKSLGQAIKVYDDIPGFSQRAAVHGVAAIHLEVIV